MWSSGAAGVGANKGEERSAFARAIFFSRLDETCDRSFEQQRYRASGLWNTVYLGQAIAHLRHPTSGPTTSR